MGDVDIESITPERIRTYLVRVPSRATRQRRLAAIKRFFRHLEIVRRMPNPVRKMRYPKRDWRLPAVLSEKEIDKLIGEREPCKDDRAGWRDRALIETMYPSGLRVSEAVALNWGDIDRETGMIGHSKQFPGGFVHARFCSEVLDASQSRFCQVGERRVFRSSSSDAKRLPGHAWMSHRAVASSAKRRKSKADARAA